MPDHSQRHPRIGIDLGGTKIEGVALGANGEVRVRERIDTPRAYEPTIDAITAMVRRIEVALADTATVGLGIPGVIVPDTGLVKNANSTWLNGQPLQRDLSAALNREVRVQNDANCFALSEASDGAAAGAPVVFGVIMGTGVGGGVIVNGEVLSGRNLIGGEWGHNPLPWPSAEEREGRACYCGRSGCIETWISGPGIAADHAHHAGGTLTAPEIIAAAAAGDADALATRARLVHRTARSLATIINVLDPHVIVLGGGVSNVAGLVDDVAAAVPPWVFSDRVETRIVRHQHGDASGVRGAAWLWPASGG
jgi:fructokinase